MDIVGKINNHKASQSDALKMKINSEYDASQPVAPVKKDVTEVLNNPTSVTPSLATLGGGGNAMAGAEKADKPWERLNEADFEARKAEMNVSDKEYWRSRYEKDPNSAYALLKEHFASDETPEQKRKRERREALGETFRNLGNLIGNAANLYYTHRGGQYIDLNTANEKHREYLERLKEKQEAIQRQREQILVNAKLEDFRNKRAEDAAKKQAEWKTAEGAKEREWKMKYDVYMKELDNAYKLGQIDAQTKAKLAEQSAKTKSDKELESIRQSNRIALKTTPSYGQDKVVTSVTGSDGNVYTRNTKLDDVEVRELSKYVEDWAPYTKVDEDGKETIDYIGAIADAAESGMIPVEVLEQMGYKNGKKDGGFSYGKKSSDKQSKGYSFK